jgi:hypothetical protein
LIALTTGPLNNKFQNQSIPGIWLAGAGVRDKILRLFRTAALLRRPRILSGSERRVALGFPQKISLTPELEMLVTRLTWARFYDIKN